MKGNGRLGNAMIISIEGDSAGKVASLAERLLEETRSDKEPQPDELSELLQELVEIIESTEEEGEAEKHRHRSSCMASAGAECRHGGGHHKPHRHRCVCGRKEAHAEAGFCGRRCGDGANASGSGSVRQTVELLAECFGRKLSPALMAVYEDILSGVDPSVLELSARRCMAAPRGGMPTPGRLLHDASTLENLEDLSMQELRKRIIFACTKDGWDDGSLITELESRLARGERWPD